MDDSCIVGLHFSELWDIYLLMPKSNKRLNWTDEILAQKNKATFEGLELSQYVLSYQILRQKN